MQPATTSFSTISCFAESVGRVSAGAIASLPSLNIQLPPIHHHFPSYFFSNLFWTSNFFDTIWQHIFQSLFLCQLPKLYFQEIKSLSISRSKPPPTFIKGISTNTDVSFIQRVQPSEQFCSTSHAGTVLMLHVQDHILLLQIKQINTPGFMFIVATTDEKLQFAPKNCTSPLLNHTPRAYCKVAKCNMKFAILNTLIFE